MTKSITMPNANLILVTGGTEADPITHEEIYQESLASGWMGKESASALPAVQKQGETQYRINVNIMYGDAVANGTETWLKDTGISITYGAPSNRCDFKVSHNATFTCGALDEDDLPVHGCTIVVNPNWRETINGVVGGNSQSFLYADTYNHQRGVIQWYGCSIDFRYAGFSNCAFAKSITIIGGSIRASGVWYFTGGTTGQVKDVDIDVLNTVYLYSLNLPIVDIKLIGRTEAFLCRTDAKFRDVDFGTRGLNRNKYATIYLFDCLIQDDKIISSEPASSQNKVLKYFTHSALVKNAAEELQDGYRCALLDANTNSVHYNELSLNGVVPPVEVLSKAFDYANNTNVLTITDTSVTTLRVRKFGSLFKESRVTLKAKIESTVEAEEDSKLSETDQAIVNAYTELDAAQKVYDYSRSWLSTDSGMAFADPIALVGDGIETTHDVMIDANAQQPFDFDGTIITIKANVFTGNITTTGTITLNNNASVDGVLLDANSDSVLTFSGIDSWTLYTSAAHRDSHTSPIASGTAIETYRFNYAANTTYYLRLEAAGTTLFQDTTPIKDGETQVSLSIPALLTVQGRILQLTKDHARAANTQTQRAA